MTFRPPRSPRDSAAAGNAADFTIDAGAHLRPAPLTWRAPAGGMEPTREVDDGAVVDIEAPSAAQRAASRERAALFAMRPSALARFFARQPAAFWFLAGYLFVEYVRPQGIYAPLAGLPLAKGCILAALAAMLIQGTRIRFGLAERWLALFSAIVLASTATALYPDVSVAALPDYFNWVIIYLLVANVVDTEARFFVFLLMFMVWNFKMSFHGVRSWAGDGFRFREWGTEGAPGFFGNSGEFGIEMIVFMAVVTTWISGLRQYWKKWLFVAWTFVALTALLSIVGSSSRGALIGAAAAGAALVSRTRFKTRAFIAAIVLGAVVFVLLPPEAKARFASIGSDHTSQTRKLYWSQGLGIIQQFPVLGIGFKDWMAYHWAHFGPPHQLPHNIFIEVTSELGFGALFAFVGLIASTVILNRRTRKLVEGRPDGRFMSHMSAGLDAAMWGYLVAGQFVTVFYYPFFWINLAMTAALHNAAVRLAASERTAGTAS